MNSYFQQIILKSRLRYKRKIVGVIRRYWYSFLGMKIGSGTFIQKLYITWPNQVSIGSSCILEHNIYFKYHGVLNNMPSIKINNNVFIGSNCEFNIGTKIEIGNNSLIASGCRFIDHDHGTKLGSLIGPQTSADAPIEIGSDVWLGCNVVVLKGVTISNGVVVAAGAVVTKSIPPNEIWAGIPARKISQRKL
jgi:acetyltransferase-like isoleucine patch superfamily enzyme